MARTKGSKNRGTMEKELQARGIAVPAGLDYDGVLKLYNGDKKPLPPPPPTVKNQKPPKPAPPPQRIGKNAAQSIFDATQARFKNMLDYYHGDEVPENAQDCLMKVFFATNVEEANAIAHKAVGKLEMYLLSAWGNRRISGPDTPTNIAGQIRRCKKTISMLESKGDAEGVAQQRVRLAELETEARMLKKGDDHGAD